MPERVSGPPPLDAARRSTWAGAALQALERVSGPPLDAARRSTWEPRGSLPPALDAARRSTWEPRGSFLLAGAALQALDGARARFGAPPLDADTHTHAHALTDLHLRTHLFPCSNSQLYPLLHSS